MGKASRNSLACRPSLPGGLTAMSVGSESSKLQNLQVREGERYMPKLEDGHRRQDSSTIRALVHSPPWSPGCRSNSSSSSSSSSSGCVAKGAVGASGSGPRSSSTELSEGYWYVVSSAVSLKEILSCL